MINNYTLISQNSLTSSTFLNWLRGLAIALLFIGIACNIMFYYSFSTGFFSGAVYTILGALFDLIKISLVVLFAIFLYNNKIKYAVLVAMTWLLLSAISLLAAFGFISNINAELEKEQIKSSETYMLAKNQLEDATNALNGYSTYADKNTADNAVALIETTQANIDSYLLQNATNINGIAVGTIASRVGDCSATNYYTKAYCNKINQYKKIIAENKQIIANHNAFLSASTYKNQLQSDFNNVDASNANLSYAPVFHNLSALIGIAPNKIKSFVLVLLSIITEFVSSLIFFVIEKAKLIPNQFTQRQEKKINTDVTYEAIKTAILNKEITAKALSYNGIEQNFGLKNKQAIKEVRDKLHEEKIARYDASNKLVIGDLMQTNLLSA